MDFYNNIAGVLSKKRDKSNSWNNLRFNGYMEKLVQRKCE